MSKPVKTVFAFILSFTLQPSFALSAKEQVEGCLQGKIATKSCMTMIANYWKHAPAIEKIAREEGVDPNLLKALVAHESRYNHKAVSPVRATGLTQVMPGTAAGLGVNHIRLFDAEVSIRTGSRYLRQMLNEFKSVDLALAAYNAGLGNVRKYGYRIPPFRETRNYVRNVTSLYRLFQEKSSKTDGYNNTQGGLQHVAANGTQNAARVSLPSKPTAMRGKGSGMSAKTAGKKRGYFKSTGKADNSSYFQSTSGSAASRSSGNSSGYFQSTGG